jgi:carbon monoxide dehydrogenase subunit G
MPSVTHRSRAAVPPGDFWNLIVTLDNWADLIPGYVRHTETTADESVWTVRGDVGILTRDVKLRVFVTRREAPHLVEFRIEGITEQMVGHGTFRVAPEPSGARAEASTAPKLRLLARLISRLQRRLLRSPGLSRRTTTVAGAAPVDSTEFAFELDLEATGITGPVVNRLIAPLLTPAAETLADGIAIRAENSALRSEGARLTVQGKGDQ